MINKGDKDYNALVALCAERMCGGPLYTSNHPRTKKFRSEVSRVIGAHMPRWQSIDIVEAVDQAERMGPQISTFNMLETTEEGKFTNNVADTCVQQAYTGRVKIFRPTIMVALRTPDNRVLFVQSPKAAKDGNWTLVQEGSQNRDEPVVQTVARCLWGDGKNGHGEEVLNMGRDDIDNLHLHGVYDFMLPEDRKARDGFGDDGDQHFGKRYIALTADYTGPRRLEVDRSEIAHYRWPKDPKRYLRKIRNPEKRAVITAMLEVRQKSKNALGIR